jgi:membrane fusion protein, heavy metal efflux system
MRMVYQLLAGTSAMRTTTIFAGAVLVMAGCRPSETARTNPGQLSLTPAQLAELKVVVEPITEQVVDDTIMTSGTVALEDVRSGHVFSPVTGRVTKILVQLGQRVAKGDPLATIESPDVATAVSDVNKAQADLINAEHDLKRKKELYYIDKAASAADVEASEDTERKARAELERARQKQYLLRVGNVDTVTLTYTMPSPIDGEVLMRNINPGVEVQGQYSGGAQNVCLPGLQSTTVCGELFTIGEVDKVWVLGDIYEVDLSRVHVGAQARVTTVAYKEPFIGTVDWISGSLDPNTRTAKVRCTFDNPDKKLRPMMYTTIEIAVDQRKAVAIPRSSMVRMGDYNVVFIETGEQNGQTQFERLPVEVSESPSAPFLAVKHGVDAGQKIVVSGADALSKKI